MAYNNVILIDGDTKETDPDLPQVEIKGFDFSEKSIRLGFIRKVYSILMSQLLITLSAIATSVYHEPTRLWLREHPETMLASAGISIVLILVMACSSNVRRKAPMNFIFLFVFTLAQSLMLATLASLIASEEVIIAVGITAAVCFALTIFAFQTRWDFTLMGGILFVALFIFIIFGIASACIPGKLHSLGYSSLGAVLFSVYLVYDTQLIVGGDHEYSIDPEEYVFAALTLYLDIITIFLYILRIVAGR